jgi:hypothetical protein
MFRYLIAMLIGIVACNALAADQKWLVQAQFESFSLLSDHLVDADRIHKQLCDLSVELQETLGVTSTGQPVQIVLFESRSRYLAYLDSAVPASRHRRAVFVRKGSLTTIYCYRSDTTITDLRHEMTHAVLHQHLQFLPLWMDEGLAEYFEEEPNQRHLSSRTKGIRWKSATGWIPDLERLEKISAADDMDSSDYRDSWAVCCFLINDSDDSKALLRDYLQQIHSGKAPPRFSMSLNSVGIDWKRRSKAYFRKPVFRVAGELSGASKHE